MPLYNTASAAIALDVPPKWLDNLLSHHSIPGVQQARQGVPRRLSSEAIEIIAVARSLTESAGLPLTGALKLGHDLCTTRDASIDLTPFLSVSLNVHQLRHALTEKLASAMELTPQPLRGRPAKRKQGAHSHGRPVDPAETQST